MDPKTRAQREKKHRYGFIFRERITELWKWIMAKEKEGNMLFHINLLLLQLNPERLAGPQSFRPVRRITPFNRWKIKRNAFPIENDEMRVF